MAHEIPKDLLNSLYFAICENGPPTEPRHHRLAEIASTGWVLSHAVEDMLLMADRRFDAWRHPVDIDALGKAVGRGSSLVCTRPRKRSIGVALLSGWSAIDFASLLIFLEDLSFAVDPKPLVDALLPTLPKRGYIPANALDLLWYDRTRRRSERTLVREGERGRSSGIVEKAAHGGYRLVAVVDDEGVPLTLTVTGPKYRRQPEPKGTICSECGVEWYRGDPDSSASHRREHQSRMRYLDPQPSPQMLAARLTDDDAEHVDSESAVWKHEEVYARALAFKREKRYDFVQWTKSGDTDPEAHAYLFTSKSGVIVGACAFRLRSFEGLAEKRYGLQWIWVAPQYRRQGFLRQRWKRLRERHGDFWIEPPVSEDMRSFLAAMGDEKLMDYPTPAPDLLPRNA
jgi:GNAT superfamily N-acetyltransferase